MYVPLRVCHGARYSRETLEVSTRGGTVDVLIFVPIAEAAQFFADARTRHLNTLVEVGLGYDAPRTRIEQPCPAAESSTRQKACFELQRRSTGRTVYVSTTHDRPALRRRPQAPSCCSP